MVGNMGEGVKVQWKPSSFHPQGNIQGGRDYNSDSEGQVAIWTCSLWLCPSPLLVVCYVPTRVSSQELFYFLLTILRGDNLVYVVNLSFFSHERNSWVYWGSSLIQIQQSFMWTIVCANNFLYNRQMLHCTGHKTGLPSCTLNFGLPSPLMHHYFPFQLSSPSPTSIPRAVYPVNQE